MKNLMDYYGRLTIAGLVPIVMASSPLGAQQELAVKGNVADFVREYVVEHGSDTTYEMDGTKIPAKHRRLSGDNLDLTIFEMGGVPYLVVSTTIANQSRS